MAKKEVEVIDNSTVLYKSLEQVLHESMIPYAEYVILDRAIPRVEDGLKPVQRRILYSMRDLGLTPDKPYRKSARLVGDCLGKYHPHGDTSIYDAMVRLAQPFNMRHTLVDGHGNFGTVDGDGAAAMRYTEARLNPLAMELLRDIDKETVKWNLNFDDSCTEPDTLPGRFPNLLVNGCMGIAVGLATNIPPHNLAEVIDGVIEFINNPKVSLEGIMKFIKGPDFPTGGYIIAGDELLTAYKTGRGKISIRAKVYVEGARGEKQSIVITELPYQVNKANLLKKILGLREDDKANFGDISDIVDESDRNGMRAVIKLKKDCDAQKMLDKLFVKTDLQSNFGINMVAIADGKPQQLGLLDIISYYVEYQRDIVVRRTKFDLAKAKERAHIVEGLLIAVKNIDKVIKIIKTSASVSAARQNLRDAFNLSEKQAQAILDMRLARLTALEVTRLEEEYKELMLLIEKLNGILSSKANQMAVVKEELLDIKKRFKDARRSIIMGKTDEIHVPSDSDKKPVYNYCIGLSADNTIKKMPLKSIVNAPKDFNEDSKTCNALGVVIQTQDDHTLYAMSNLGNCFKIPLDMLPECRWRDVGITLNKVFKEAEPGEYIVKMYPLLEQKPTNDVLIMTKLGMVKRVNWDELVLLKSAYQVMKLKDGDEVLEVENFKENHSLLFVTKKGLVLKFQPDDIPLQGRVAGGVKGIMLSDDDEVVAARLVKDDGEILVITSEAFAHKVPVSSIEMMSRYRKGVKVIDFKGDSQAYVMYSNYVVAPFVIFARTVSGKTYSVLTNNIIVEDRTKRGKSITEKSKGEELCFALKNKIEWKIKVRVDSQTDA